MTGDRRADRAPRHRPLPHADLRFDLAQAARRGVIRAAALRAHPAGGDVRSIAKVPLRKGEVDQDFDQEELAALLDQGPSTPRSRTSTRALQGPARHRLRGRA